jgi:hypothetical protein
MRAPSQHWPSPDRQPDLPSDTKKHVMSPGTLELLELLEYKGEAQDDCVESRQSMRDPELPSSQPEADHVATIQGGGIHDVASLPASTVAQFGQASGAGTE